MDTFSEADLLVVGAGSAGVRAARLAAADGADVAVVEAAQLGGTCVNLGCIPKKLFYYASHFAADFSDATSYGWKLPQPAQFDWPHLVRAKNQEIERLNRVYEKLLEDVGARIVRGRARLLGQGRVAVGDECISATKILLAPGSRPWRPNFPGSEALHVSDEMFHLSHLPERVAVLGGGYIAVEFAGILAGLGRQAHLVYRGSPLLRGFDREVRAHVTEQIVHHGVQLHLNSDVAQLERLAGGSLRLHLSDERTLDADLVLAACGRVANTSALGLEKAEVETDSDGNIQVDSGWRTSAEGIYALGDAIGTPQLTPLAIAQAQDFYQQVFQGAERKLDYRAIPTAVFCQPSIGAVGMTEEEAVSELGQVRVYSSSFRALKNTLAGGDERVLTKLIVDDASDRVVGAHIVGGEAGEIIQGLALGVRHGLTKAQFDQTIGVHPTTAEEFVTMKTSRPAELA